MDGQTDRPRDKKLIKKQNKTKTNRQQIIYVDCKSLWAYFKNT